MAGASWKDLPMATLPADIDPDSRFRLPLPKREALDEAGRRVYDRVTDPKGGTIVGIRGPAGIQLYSPKLAEYARPLNSYLRFECGLGARTREIAILATAREFDSQFEWAAHEPEALKEGVPAELIDIIKHRKSTAGLAAADAVVIDLAREYYRTRKVSAATFARAAKQFAPGDLVNLVALMGNYAGTALLLATFDMQLPPGQAPLLPVP
jgi:4-carboxymuconolactone decarboxylase